MPAAPLISAAAVAGNLRGVRQNTATTARLSAATGRLLAAANAAAPALPVPRRTSSSPR